MSPRTVVIGAAVALQLLTARTASASLLGFPVYVEYYYDLAAEQDDPPLAGSGSQVIDPLGVWNFSIPDGAINTVGGRVSATVGSSIIELTIQAGCLQVGCPSIGGVIFQGGPVINALRLFDNTAAIAPIVSVQFLSASIGSQGVPVFFGPDSITFDFRNYAFAGDLSQQVTNHLRYQVGFGESVPVPEPATLGLLLIGMSLVYRRSRRRS